MLSAWFKPFTKTNSKYQEQIYQVILFLRCRKLLLNRRNLVNCGEKGTETPNPGKFRKENSMGRETGKRAPETGGNREKHDKKNRDQCAVHILYSKKNKMASVSMLSEIKLLFGPLVSQLVWYILKHLFTTIHLHFGE